MKEIPLAYPFDKAELYVALGCVDRIRGYLEHMNLAVPDVIHGFIDDVWAVLKGEKAKIALTRTDRQIGRWIIDEQDAGLEESMVNRLYYALSDLILYLKYGNSDTVECVLEETLEFFRFVSANDYMLAIEDYKGILDDEDEARIEADPRVQHEKDRQARDRSTATTVSDWSTINRPRYDNTWPLPVSRIDRWAGVGKKA